MINIEQLPPELAFNMTEERQSFLDRWCAEQVEDAFSSRAAYDRTIIENMRQYEGQSSRRFRKFPFEGAPNYEFNLTATTADTIYAQSLDLIISQNPILNASAANKDFVEHEFPMQRFIDNGVNTGEWGFRTAMEHGLMDATKHGTMVFYIPFIERTKLTDRHRITSRGPLIHSLSLEDALFPGGTEEPHDARWSGIRLWLNEGDLEMRRKHRGWKTEFAQQTPKFNAVRTVRQRFGRTREAATNRSKQYEIIMLFASVPMEDNGVERDLLIFFDRTSKHVLYATPMPYDRWPMEAARYQLREHMMWGMGVVEMGRNYQAIFSDMMNEMLANVRLANMRGFKGPHGGTGGSDTLTMRPGKYHAFNDPGSVEIFQLADIYPSMPVALSFIQNLLERRTGVNAVSSPSASQVVGSRTPGITALSFMQQANRRFAPAFESERQCLARTVKQCLFRYSERIMAGDTQTIEHIRTLLPDKQGELVLEVLEDQNFTRNMRIEISATTSATNKMQERQDAIQMAGVLGQYYDKTLQMLSIGSQEGVSPSVREAAIKIADATGLVIKRTVETFDQVRDPERFILDVEAEIDGLPDIPPAGIAGLQELLQGAGGQGGGSADQSPLTLIEGGAGGGNS